MQMAAVQASWTAHFIELHEANGHKQSSRYDELCAIESYAYMPCGVMFCTQPGPDTACATAFKASSFHIMQQHEHEVLQIRYACTTCTWSRQMLACVLFSAAKLMWISYRREEPLNVALLAIQVTVYTAPWKAATSD